MKKAIIKARFRDKDNHSVVYNPGDVAEFNDDRVVALAARGLVEPVADETDSAEDTEKEASTAKSTKGKKAKASKSKKDAPAETEPSENAIADNPDESDAPEEVETENETINPDKDEQ